MAKLTDKKRDAFLEALGKGLSVTTAAQAVGHTRSSMYGFKERDKDFSDAWDEAVEQGTDVIEDHVLKMGLNDKNLTALIFLLNGRRPEKFKQRHDVTSNGQSLFVGFSKAMAALEDAEAKDFNAKDASKK